MDLAYFNKTLLYPFENNASESASCKGKKALVICSFCSFFLLALFVAAAEKPAGTIIDWMVLLAGVQCCTFQHF